MVLTHRIARVRALTTHEQTVRTTLVDHYKSQKAEPWIDGIPARYHASVSTTCHVHADFDTGARHNWDCAPEYYKFNDSIVDYYRVILSPSQALYSVFQLHSETVNILTHLLPFGWYLLLLAYISSGPFGVLDMHLGIPSLQHGTTTDQWIFTIMMGSYTLTWLFSTVFHTFNCCGPRAYYNLLSLDFVGLCCTFLGYMLAPVYYMFSDHPTLRFFYLTFIALGVSVTGYLILLDKSGFLMKGGSASRVIVFGTLSASGFIPVTHKLLLDWMYDPVEFEALKSLFGHLVASCVVLIIGGACYLYRFPDAFLPRGAVNIFIQGHSLMHIFVSIAPLIHYVGVYGYYMHVEHQQCRTEWWPLPFE